MAGGRLQDPEILADTAGVITQGEQTSQSPLPPTLQRIQELRRELEASEIARRELASQLQQVRSSLTEQVDDLTSELRTLHSRFADTANSTQHDHDEAQRLAAQREQELVTLRSERDRANQSTSAELTKAKHHADRLQCELDACVEQLRSATDDNRKQIAELRQQAMQMSQGLKASQEEHARTTKAWSTRADEAQQQAKVHERDLLSANEKLRNEISVRESTAADLSNARRDIAALEAQSKARQKDSDRLGKARAAELADAHKHNQRLERDLAAANELARNQNAAKDATAGLLAETRAQIAQLEGQIKSLHKDQNKTEKASASALAGAMKRGERLQRDLTARDAQLLASKATAESTAEQLAEACEAISNLEGQLRAQQKEQSKLEKGATAEQARLEKTAAAELAEARKQAARAERDLGRAKEALQEEIDSLRSETHRLSRELRDGQDQRITTVEGLTAALGEAHAALGEHINTAKRFTRDERRAREK